MVVIAGDDASGEALLPWIGNGFRALGAASIAAEPSDAALPFDARRNGMLLGAGGIGMVLETEVSEAAVVVCGLVFGGVWCALYDLHPDVVAAAAAVFGGTRCLLSTFCLLFSVVFGWGGCSI